MTRPKRLRFRCGGAALLVLVALAGCPRPLATTSEATTSRDRALLVPRDAVLVARADDLGEAAPALAPLAVGLDALGPLTPLFADELFQDGARLAEQAGISRDGRLVLSVRADGARVLFLPVHDRARFESVLQRAMQSLGARPERPLGEVRAFVDARGRSLLLSRAVPGGVLLEPSPARALESAALLEAMARGDALAERMPGADDDERAPADVELYAGAGLERLALPLSAVLGDVSARGLRASFDTHGDRLEARVRVALDEETASALGRAFAERSPSAPGFCRLEEGALVVARLPAGLTGAFAPDDAGGDRLRGQVGIALYPAPAGTAQREGDPLSYLSATVVSTPADADAEGALRSALTLDEGAPAEKETVAGRAVTVLVPPDGASHRVVRAVVEPDVFALSLGAPRAFERALSSVGRCPTEASPLWLRMDVTGLARAVEGAQASGEGLPERVLSVLARLAGALDDDVRALEGSAELDGRALRLEISAILRHDG